MPMPNPRMIAAAGSVAAVVLAGSAEFVGPWEGLYTRMYRDIVGVPTICYGATAADGVDLTRTYTEAECKSMLGNSLKKYYTAWTACVKPPKPMTINMQVAFTSFAYNLGPGAFCNGSLARKVNAGDYAGACHSIRLYNMAKVTSQKYCLEGTFRNASGRCPVKGLDNRRRAEEKKCMEGL